MNIAQSKRIPIEVLLNRLGYEPERRSGDQLWYKSPFRNEQTASFKVNTQLNAWYDFGIGQGGDGLDLLAKLENLSRVSDALLRLRSLVESDSDYQPTQTSHRSEPDYQPSPPTEIIRVGPIQSASLQSYLLSRGIDPHEVADVLQEVHYQRGGKSYYGLGFANNNRGYEVRNPYFKGCLGPKGISILPGSTERILVFEGFFDYLTYRMQFSKPKSAAIVLNSVSMQEAAIVAIQAMAPERVDVFRDCDPAGELLLVNLQNRCNKVEVVDRSDLYVGHKDFNAWWVAQSQEEIRLLTAGSPVVSTQR